MLFPHEGLGRLPRKLNSSKRLGPSFATTMAGKAPKKCELCFFGVGVNIPLHPLRQRTRPARKGELPVLFCSCASATTPTTFGVEASLRVPSLKKGGEFSFASIDPSYVGEKWCVVVRLGSPWVSFFDQYTFLSKNSMSSLLASVNLRAKRASGAVMPGRCSNVRSLGLLVP